MSQNELNEMNTTADPQVVSRLMLTLSYRRPLGQ